jgi:hypothetical protein
VQQLNKKKENIKNVMTINELKNNQNLLDLSSADVKG